jgi:hypothetical protein
VRHHVLHPLHIHIQRVPLRTDNEHA